MFVRTVKSSKEQYLSVAYMMGSDCHLYGVILEDLENRYVCRKNEWPNIITGVNHILTSWKKYRHQTPYDVESIISYAMRREGYQGGHGRGPVVRGVRG